MYTVDQVKKLIAEDKVLMLAGDETLLRQLPKGNWIGGTIPYFMTEDGGMVTHDQIQVIELPSLAKYELSKPYSVSELKNIPDDYAKNGVSLIIIPALTEVHATFAKECSTYPGIFDRPLVGWISGVNLKDLGSITPKAFDGKTGEVFEDKAVVLHLSLPENKYGKVNIINLFKQGSGDTLSFPTAGFEVTDCFVNGEKKNFADYIKEKQIDTQLPLVASYMGAMINVSFQAVDDQAKKVSLYAPVFPLTEYKLASPVDNYEEHFANEMKKEVKSPVFSCNCILNFLYAGLEGKKTGEIVGPITFGEIAYMLLNQTMVYITIEDI